MAPHRAILAGNNEAATLVLDLLLDWLPRESVLAIAPRDSDIPSWQRSLAAHASKRGVTCIQPDRVNEAETTSRIAAHRPTLLLSVYYTQIFSSDLLAQIDGPSLNFHPSLLPRHRGVAPLIWAILEGDSETGVSVHHLDEGIDTGELVMQLPVPIDPDDTGFSLHRKAARAVREAALGLRERLAAGADLPDPWPQRGESSYHPASGPKLNRIDWAWPRERVRNVVRALAPPLPGAYSMLGEDRLVFARVEPVPIDQGRKAPVGTIIPGEGGGDAVIVAGDGPVAIRSVVCDGKCLSGSQLATMLHLDGPRRLA